MMTEEQKAAYVQGQVACALIEMQSMIVANQERERQGKAFAHAWRKGIYRIAGTILY